MSKKRVRKQTVTQQIMQKVYALLESHEHDLTRKQYARQVKQYIKYCREQFDARSFEECSIHIQEYSNYLQKERYTASTIHTYLSAVCNVFSKNLSDISKPIRHTANYTKGRQNALQDTENDFNNLKHAHIVEFQRCAGLRRNELRHLTGADLIRDESGYLCIHIRKGKGGKTQYQRILEEDEPFIRSYFENTKQNERIFEEKYFKNNLNFHALRAESARKYYEIQIQKINENPHYRTQLEQEIRARWNAMNISKNGKVKPLAYHELCGVYTLRGKNRALARAKGLSVHYDKTALLATSIFKLSHWRNDVTIASYMLA